MKYSFEAEGGNFLKAGYASSTVKQTLKQLNIDSKTIKRVVVALFEGEINVVAHAEKGTIEVEIDSSKVMIKIKDTGPGIPDIDMAMQVGFSTASAKVREMGFGAGMGLPNIKNNVDELSIKSEVGIGTELIMIIYFTENS